MGFPFPHTRKGIAGSLRALGLAAFICMFFMLGLMLAPSAWAACASPTGAGGDIIYNDDENVLSYCDDTNWIAVRGSGSQGYIPNAVNMDASTNLEQTSGLTGISDSKTATGSLWVRTSDNPAGDVSIVGFTSFKFGVLMEAPGDNIRILGANAGSTTILEMETSTAINDGNWHHIMFSFDLTNGASRHLYVDGVDALAGTPSTHTDDFVDFTTQTYVGGPGNWNADIADMWLDAGTYIDLSQASNRALFYNNGPVYLGADGSIPTGSAPEMFLSGITNTWHTNDGTGGGFTEIGTLTTASSFPGQNDTSLVGHWKLDETSGSVIADSGSGGNNGTWADGSGNNVAEETAAGRIDNAITYDGTDDAITIGSPANLNGIFAGGATLATWVNLSSIPAASSRFFDKNQGGSGQGWLFGVDPSGTLRFDRIFTGNNGSWNTSTTTTPLGEWVHVAITYNEDATGNDPVFYINGIAVTTINETNAPSGSAANDSTDTIVIGNRVTGNRPVDGLMDDVRMYNRVLSATEIGALAAACEESSIVYNKDHHVPQYCAGGDRWTAMGPVRDGIDSGLVGHYTLDETGGTTANDSSGTGNNGTMLNFNAGAATSDGKVTNSFDFDGSNDRIDIPSDASIDDIFSSNGGGTWAAWIYARTTGENNSGRIIDKRWSGGSPSLLISSGSTIDFEVNFTTTDGNWQGPAINLAEWHHVVLTYDDSSTANDPTLYINGASQSLTELSTPAGTPVSDAGHQLSIGNINNATSRTWDGFIDDVRVYNRMITPAEVMALYELGDGRSDPSLIGHWKLDDLSGTTATDSTASANDGTLNNFDTPPAWTSSAPLAGALTFDGTDDYIDMGDVLDMGTEDRTISAWAKIDNCTGTQDPIAGKRQNSAGSDGYDMKIHCGAGGIVRTNFGGASASSYTLDSTTDLRDGLWHHIVTVWDRDGNASVYVDGTLENFLDISAESAYDVQGVVSFKVGAIGNTAVNTTQFLNGNIDDVRVYNRVLSATEIDALYKMGIGHCTGPVGKEGDLIYNDDVGVDALQYCDGANWQAVGKSP